MFYSLFPCAVDNFCEIRAYVENVCANSVETLD